MASPTQASGQPASQKQKWNPPSLTLKWGPYFTPDPEDENKTVTTTVEAKTAGIITTRMAVEKVARIFGVENVDAVLDDIEGEKAEADARELEKTAAEAESLHKAAAGVATGASKPKRPGSGKKPKKPTSG